MINYEKKLRKENNQQEKQLTKENQEILIDMVVYLHSADLCEYDIEIIRKDLFGMAWEGQLRGEDFRNVIGGDFKLFCDELIKFGRKKMLYEKALEMLYIGTFGIGAILIFQIITHIINNIAQKNIKIFSFDMPITLGLVVLVICAWIAGFGIFYFVSKNSFELSKKITKKYKMIFIGIYLMTFVIMTLSLVFLRNIVLFSANFVYIIIIILLASIIITILNATHSKYLANTHK